MKDLLLSIDQGTTGTTVLAMSPQGETLARHTEEFAQHYPEPGRVEHDAAEIWTSLEKTVAHVLGPGGIDASRIAAIGITNQRETTLLWDRKTGEHVHRAIVWQDRRTAPACEALKAAGHEATVRAKTGLVLDPYFSGTKLAWMLDAVDGARARAERGELAFGTIDSWLIHRLSGGARHATDVTNASRTLLMGLASLAWDDELLSLFRVPRAVLPEIVPSAGVIATTKGVRGLPDGIPIAGVAGDQQAALFGQACFDVGDSKCTYGTGAFALTNIGGAPKPSTKGLLTTVAWQIPSGVAYALEGSAFIAGAAVQWLRDGLGVITTAAEIEALAATVPSSDGVVFVPALAGLGAPHWDPHARGLVSGITRGTTKAHLARAVLEGVAFEVADLLAAMRADLGAPLKKMRVDGGAAANDLLMQFQADVATVRIERPRELESTARGAAMLAGVGVGLFASADEARAMSKPEKTFDPRMDPAVRDEHLRRWAHAVRLATTH
ncbi:MAG TPA: glycerol kinase GlpK [Polyangiaceae bacterium]|nr:glycerol kinase GlpK [Polyangiaceae bacterium]